ncbi:Transglutaminase-like superfamily protein [anaerobic digester metagenome]
MKWLKNNRVKVLVLLIHSLMLAKLLMDAYEVRRADPFGYLPPLLGVAIPVLLIGIGLAGLLRDLKPVYGLFLLIGALFLWQTYHYDTGAIIRSVQGINDKLSASRPLVYQDFAYLLENIVILVLALSFLTIYAYPWNLLLTDLAFLFFLWAVDSLTDPAAVLTSFVFLWAFVLVHERILVRDAEYATFRVHRIDGRARMLQGIAIALCLGLIAMSAVPDRKGTYYEKIWMKANDYLMQDDFLPGNYFLDAFSLSRTGYQDSSTRLGGNVTLDQSIALRLAEDIPEYLRGNTKRVYTGRIWEKSDFLYRTDNAASSLVTQAYRSAAQKRLTVLPEELLTSSLFVPVYPGSVTLSDRSRDNRIYYSIQDQTFMVSEEQADPYTVVYYDQEAVEGYAMAAVDPAVPEDRRDYLQLPDTITQRTVDLVEDIVGDREDPAEKMLALTTYLRDNYEYTLSPGSFPEGDFVDHFLFEVREGYCVYYATALTVMLRIAGIPARYVEGFRVSSEVDTQGNRLVRNSDAHAWAEVLTDPERDLWTIWDATGTAREHGQTGGGTGSNPTPTEPGGTPATTPIRTLAEDTLPDTTPGNGAAPTPGETTSERNLPPWLSVSWIGLISLGGLILWKKQRVKRLLEDPGDQAFLDFIIRLLKESGLEITESQTLSEISRRISDHDLQRQFIRYGEAHYKARYGSTPHSVAAAVRARLLEETLRYHRITSSRPRHLLRRWIL